MDLQMDTSHRPKALTYSLILYSLFLAALLFFKLIYEPFEEPLAMGVDLNYGVDLVGSGNIQTMNKASDSPNNYDVKPAQEISKKTNTSPPTPTSPNPRKSSTKSTQTSKGISSKVESPVKVKNTPEASSKTATTQGPTNNDPPAPPRSVDQGSLFQKGSTGGSRSNGTVGKADGIGGNNNGDGPAGSVGDQGDPRGTLDGKSLYGNPGSGGGTGGANVSIRGWDRKNLDLPKDKSSETGRIVFDVTIDDRGDVIKLVTKSSTVSPSVTKYYSDYIKKNLGRYLTPQGNPPPTSNGTITINITN